MTFHGPALWNEIQQGWQCPKSKPCDELIWSLKKPYPFCHLPWQPCTLVQVHVPQCLLATHNISIDSSDSACCYLVKMLRMGSFPLINVPPKSTCCAGSLRSNEKKKNIQVGCTMKHLDWQDMWSQWYASQKRNQVHWCCSDDQPHGRHIARLRARQ